MLQLLLSKKIAEGIDVFTKALGQLAANCAHFRDDRIVHRHSSEQQDLVSR